jgi:hypothetical protein
MPWPAAFPCPSPYPGLNFDDPFGLCPDNVTRTQALACVIIEGALGILGSGAGFLVGGGGGALAAAPTGGLAAPVTVPAGAVAGMVGGGTIGKLAGERLTDVLFSKSARGGESSPQDKLLTDDEIRRLKRGGEDIHALKGGKNASSKDLYKDRRGDIFVKPKGGKGPGEPTGLNIKDFK